MLDIFLENPETQARVHITESCLRQMCKAHRAEGNSFIFFFQEVVTCCNAVYKEGKDDSYLRERCFEIWESTQ